MFLHKELLSLRRPLSLFCSLFNWFYFSVRAPDGMRGVLAKFFHIASYRRGGSFGDSQTDALILADGATVNTCSSVRFRSGAMRTVTGHGAGEGRCEGTKQRTDHEPRGGGQGKGAITQVDESTALTRAYTYPGALG